MHLPVRKYAVSIRRRGKNRATARVRRRFPLARTRSRFRSIGRSCVDFSLSGIIIIAVVIVIGLFSRRPCPFAFKLSRRYSWSRCEKGWRSRGEGATCGSRGRRIERCPSLSLSLYNIFAATIFSGRFAVRLTIVGNYLPSPLRALRVLYLRRFHGGFIVVPALPAPDPLTLSPLSFSLSAHRPPRPPALARSKTSASSPIGSGLVFLLSLALDHFARLFTSPI